MDERSISTPPAEMPITSNAAHARGTTAAPIDDPRALAILTTEHWSLLSARALVYNEAFARAGMFLAFLSASLVALGLVAAGTGGFSDGFLTVAAAVLGLNLFVGLASLGRIAAASGEDLRYLHGMNRLRHAYHEMVPGLEPYFVSSHHDDLASVLSIYGPSASGSIGNALHGMTTTPGMISVICSAVAGAFGAVLALLFTHDAGAAVVAGVATAGAVFVALTFVMVFKIRGNTRDMRAIFPRPDVSSG
ncbi:MAG: hypothetical protein ABIZ52_00770 [Candidatus Limnocylindrales bacterium]